MTKRDGQLFAREFVAGFLTILAAQEMAHAAPDCRATAAATSFNFSGGVFKPEFKVQGVTGCGVNPASTGKVTYNLRIEDGDGRSDVLKNFDAQWIGRNGSSFTFSPSSPVTFKPEKVRAVKEVIDVSVMHCGCTN